MTQCDLKDKYLHGSPANRDVCHTSHQVKFLFGISISEENLNPANFKIRALSISVSYIDSDVLTLHRDQLTEYFRACVGNSFEASHDRWCKGLQHGSTERCPAAAVDSVPDIKLVEIRVSEHGYGTVGAFNDMSLHVFQQL